ncbi:GSCOCG00013004001-RA-CDS, partial [Cotesia congregata]
MLITDTPGTVFEKVAMDIVGPLPRTGDGNEYILTIQDLFSKFCVAIPLPDMLAITVADAFIKRYVSTFGAPKALLTDQGRNFISSFMQRICKRFKVKKIQTTAFRPQSNGSLERSHHVLGEYLKQYISNKTEWDGWLELAMFSYNTCVHEGTRYSPFELVFGKIARVPSSEPLHDLDKLPTYNDYIIKLVERLTQIRQLARDNLVGAKIKSKELYDKKIKPLDISIGDNVFLQKGPKPHKFGDHYEGPHEVVEVLPDGNVRIKIGNRNKITVQCCLFLLSHWGLVNAIIGYDCGSKILNMTTISLVDIDECDIGEEHIETTIPDIALLQLNEYEHTPVTQCKIEIHRVIQHCGWQSCNSIVSHGISEYILPIDREMCQVAHDHGTLRIGNTFIDGIVPNVTTIRSITLAGSVNNNADCTNAQYSDPFGTWDNVFVVGTAKIIIKSQMARVKVADDKVYLPSGTPCKLSRGKCIDPEDGYTYWQSLPRKYCISDTYTILYSGGATRLKSKTETVYSVNVRDTSFSLSMTGTETSCGVSLIRTEHPKLYIIAKKDLETLEKGNIVASNPDNLDLFLYANAKFVYVEKYLRSQVQSLYLDVIKKRCMLEKEVLKNSLSIAATQPDEFAFRYMEG